MKNNWITYAVIISITLLTIAMSNARQDVSEDNDYKMAISIAEKYFPEFKLNRADYKLVKIENDIFGKGNIPNWKLTFKDKKLFSKDGLIGKGGEVFIEVDLQAKKAKILGYGE